MLSGAHSWRRRPFYRYTPPSSFANPSLEWVFERASLSAYLSQRNKGLCVYSHIQSLCPASCQACAAPAPPEKLVESFGDSPQQTDAGCLCRSEWGFNPPDGGPTVIVRGGRCANPDHDASGPWCFVDVAGE